MKCILPAAPETVVVRYLLGRPQSVSATFGYVTGRAVEDNAAIMLRYKYG